MIGELAPIENIVRSLQSLNPSLDDIPEPIDCYCCHKPTRKAMIGYEHTIMIPPDITVEIKKELPGWRCDIGNDFFDSPMTRRFLNIIAEEMALVRDDGLQRSLKGDMGDIELTPTPVEVVKALAMHPDWK